MTEIIKVSVKNRKESVVRASEVIKSGGLVAFPTETIYGLGASALNEKAVSKIFIAKGRPQDNPLIVHVADKNIDAYVKEVPENAKKLIAKFWPGPLTLVLKKSSIIPKNVTAGLDSVAIRMPLNKIAFALIKEAGPIAAPSANLSGKPSPTSEEHVIEDMNNRVDMILAAGHCDVGLESTVLSLVDKPILLRPGRVTKEQIEKVIGPISVHSSIYGGEVDSAASPGMKYRHYAPEHQLILVNPEKLDEVVGEYEKQGKKVGVLKIGNIIHFAKIMFEEIRELDKVNDIIVVEATKETGLGMAIMNRLRKASSKIIE